jgi:hypothetical protein
VARLPEGIQAPAPGQPAERAAGQLEQPPGARLAAADDNWALGSTQRVQMLLAGLNKVRTETFPTVVSAMNAAATTDLRNVVLTPVLTRLIGRRCRCRA